MVTMCRIQKRLHENQLQTSLKMKQTLQLAVVLLKSDNADKEGN